MKRLALAAVTFILVLGPVSAAEAKKADPRSECVVAALAAGDFRAAFTCGGGGPTASAIDWD